MLVDVIVAVLFSVSCSVRCYCCYLFFYRVCSLTLSFADTIEAVDADANIAVADAVAALDAVAVDARNAVADAVVGCCCRFC